MVTKGGFDSSDNTKHVTPPAGENGLNLVDLLRPSDKGATHSDKAVPSESHVAQAQSFIKNDNIHTHFAEQAAQIPDASPAEVRAMMEHNSKLIAAYQQHMAKLPEMIEKMQT